MGDPAAVTTDGPSPHRQRSDVVFAVTPSGEPVFHQRSGGAWSAAVPLGGLLDSNVAPAQTLTTVGGYDFEVFGIGIDGAMWYRTRSSGWRSLGGAFHSEPTAVRHAGDSYVFAVGVDDALWYRTPTSGWASLGGLITSDVAVTTDGNSLYVAGIGIDQALWTRRLTGQSWSEWESLGGALTSAPVGTFDPVTATGYLAAVGVDGAIWYQGVTAGAWSGWYGLGGLAASIRPSSPRNGGLDVSVVGVDVAMWQQHWNGATWSGWHSLGGGFTSNPAATTTHTLASASTTGSTAPATPNKPPPTRHSPPLQPPRRSGAAMHLPTSPRWRRLTARPTREPANPQERRIASGPVTNLACRSPTDRALPHRSPTAMPSTPTADACGEAANAEPAEPAVVEPADPESSTRGDVTPASSNSRHCIEQAMAANRRYELPSRTYAPAAPAPGCGQRRPPAGRDRRSGERGDPNLGSNRDHRCCVVDRHSTVRRQRSAASTPRDRSAVRGEAVAPADG